MVLFDFLKLNTHIASIRIKISMNAFGRQGKAQPSAAPHGPRGRPGPRASSRTNVPGERALGPLGPSCPREAWQGPLQASAGAPGRFYFRASGAQGEPAPH